MDFTDVTIQWSSITFLFYLLIILGCVLITAIIKRPIIKIGFYKKKNCSIGLLIVTCILLFTKCLSTTGRDIRSGYYLNFISAESLGSIPDKSLEIGFRILMVLIFGVTKSYQFFLVVVGLITVLPVIYLINKYSKVIDVPIAILLYASLYFFTGFSACRQSMAVSLSLFAFDAIIEKRPYKALIWIMISSTIHVVCLILIIPYILCLSRMFSRKLILIGLVMLLVFVFIGRNSIASLLSNSKRYEIYSVNQEVRFGKEQIIYYLPLFVVIYLCKSSPMDRYFSKVSFCYLVMGFIFGIIGYIVPIFGRMNMVFIPMIIFIPYYIKTLKSRYSLYNRLVLNTVMVIYCLARFVIWITQYYNMEDLMPYTNIFGTVI